MSRMDVWMYPSSEKSSAARSMRAARVANAFSAARRGLPPVPDALFTRLLLAREVADVAPQGGDDPREVAELGGAEVDAIAHVGNRLGAVASELAAGGEHHGQRRAPVGGVGVPADELLLFELVD